MGLKELREASRNWWKPTEQNGDKPQNLIRYKSQIRTVRKECEEALFSFNPEMFKDFDVRRGFSVSIETYFTSISLYAKKLRQVENLVSKEVPVANDWTPENTKVIVLDDFFLAENGHLQNFYQAAVALRNSGLSLCKAMEASDEAEFGAYEHNLRMLTKVLSNLRDIVLIFRTI